MTGSQSNTEHTTVGAPSHAAEPEADNPPDIPDPLDHAYEQLEVDHQVSHLDCSLKLRLTAWKAYRILATRR
jgi:hypothetical protein